MLARALLAFRAGDRSPMPRVPSVALLSYREFLESIRMPPSPEVTWSSFDAWFVRIRRALMAIDTHQALEGIRGVICGRGRRCARARAGRWIGPLTDADGRHGGCSDKLMNLRDSRAVLRRHAWE
jgi:hypothetical protein